MDAKLFSCILVLSCCCLVTVTVAQVPTDCCLTTKNKVVEKFRIVDYRQQVIGQGCPISATILVTRHGKKLCAPLDESWVERVMSHVDRLKKFCKKGKYKANRCFGVKRNGANH